MQVIVNKLAVNYQDEGNGETLLMLHGWQDNLNTFDALASELSQGWRVVRLDLPGFGGSQVPPSAWNLNDYIEFVHAFLLKLQLEPVAIIGHSFGGRVAIKGIATGKLTAKKIILIGAAGVSNKRPLKSGLLFFIAKIGKAVTALPPLSWWKKSLREFFYGKIGSDYLGVGALKETYLKIIAEDLAAYAEQIRIPVLLIWGKNDSATPLADGKKYHSLITNSELAEIGDAGHFVHRDKPQAVLSLIKNFL